MGAIIKIPAHRIYRSFVLAHPELIFIYGQDYAGKGCLGQAWHVANEPNTFMVPTLYKICHSQSDKYFHDDQFDSNVEKIHEKLSLIPCDGRPIIPLQRLGRGHSMLHLKAPKTYEYLKLQLDAIKYPWIEWDWNQPQI